MTEVYSQTLSVRSLEVLWSGSQAPEPHPLCPGVPWAQGSERLMALLLKQLALCTLVSPLGERSSRDWGPCFSRLSNKAALSGSSEDPSAPPRHPLPWGSLHGTLKRGLYVCVRSDHWEARGWGWLTG